MISTGEIVTLVIFFILLCVAVFYFYVAYAYGERLKDFSYSRGVNADTTKGEDSVSLKCKVGRRICLWRATGICTNPNKNNVEIGNDNKNDPISGGSGGDKSSSYGEYNYGKNAVDLTNDMADKVNGVRAITYDIPKDKINNCSDEGRRKQLIATYACIPEGEKCTTYADAKNNS